MTQLTPAKAQELKERQRALLSTPTDLPAEATSPKVMKLAKVLRGCFDMCFPSREWDDLPPRYQAIWVETAQDVIAKMKENDDGLG